MRNALKLCSAITILLLASCTNFKPVVETARYFILTPETASDEPPNQAEPSIGISGIVLPGYLLKSHVAIRQSTHEIRYADNLRWAERLDKNIQRVLAANLGAALGTSNLYLSSWGREEVQNEVHVTIRRFEVSEDGKVQLEAKWTISEPGGNEVKESRFSSVSLNGPAPSVDAEGAVSTLSAALAELSLEIAQAIREPKK